MQLKYVFSETRSGLRRNVSMTVALILTIFVSLTLVGAGSLLYLQKNKAEDYWGSKLQITVYLCNKFSVGPHCTGGDATAPQKQAIQQVLKSDPEVASYYTQSKQQAYKEWSKIFVGQDPAERAVYKTVMSPQTMQESYWVTLKDPKQYVGVEQAVGGLDGVQKVRDLREVLSPIYSWLDILRYGSIGVALALLFAAVLEVANAIRLAAFARRREIAIMRLVGAGNLYIQLPFLMETLVAGLIGLALSAAVISGLMYFVVYGVLRPGSTIVEWVDWTDAGWALGLIAVLALLLTVVPTLVMTRKYLKV